VVLETDFPVVPEVMVVLVVEVMQVQDWQHQPIEWELLELEVEEQEHKLMNIIL
jgi:hypothetical protein